MSRKSAARSLKKPSRDLFGELTEGMTALALSRQGKRTLRTHSVEFKPAPELTAKELVRVREHLSISRAVFAACLRTNVRTLENWEQGRARPNAQAALLIHMVARFPDTVQRCWRRPNFDHPCRLNFDQGRNASREAVSCG